MKELSCPNCGHENILHMMIGGDGFRHGRMNEHGDIIYSEISMSKYTQDKYFCQHCGHEENTQEAFVKEVPDKPKTKGSPGDICVTLVDMMCQGCPHNEGYCQPISANFDPEIDFDRIPFNFAQMDLCLLAIEDRRNNIYPTEEELDYPAKDVYPNWQPAREYCGACHQELPNEEIDRICCNCGQRI